LQTACDWSVSVRILPMRNKDVSPRRSHEKRSPDGRPESSEPLKLAKNNPLTPSEHRKIGVLFFLDDLTVLKDPRREMFCINERYER
jgi:hypothetical protein